MVSLDFFVGEQGFWSCKKNKKDFLVFENLGKISWIIGLEIIWNIHRKSLRQKGTYLLTNAGGKFRLWKMAEKIITCSRRRIDGCHNVVCGFGLNITVFDVGLRSCDVASSFNGGVDLSSSSVFTNNTGILGQKCV